MSRSGYSDDDYDQWAMIMWRGAVASAIRGKRGQALLKEMLAALDMLPAPELIHGELEKDGEVCALGALGKARGLDMTEVDPEDQDSVAAFFNIPRTLACEIMEENDGGRGGRWARFEHMRKWIIANLKTPIR